jgi:RimJ/RimL family protein N-acetyltransferase
MNIRRVETSEAELFLQLTQRIEQERDQSFYQSGEAIQTAGQQAEQLAWIRDSENSEVLAAFSGEEWIGYAMALGGELRIDRHVALVVIEVVQSMQRKGVATALLQALELWSRQSGIHRLELRVLASNEAAINLYFKMGYEREGVRREARFIGNRLVDEWMMGKILK